MAILGVVAHRVTNREETKLELATGLRLTCDVEQRECVFLGGSFGPKLSLRQSPVVGHPQIWIC